MLGGLQAALWAVLIGIFAVAIASIFVLARLVNRFLGIYEEDVKSRILFRRGILDTLNLIILPLRLLVVPIRVAMKLLRS